MARNGKNGASAYRYIAYRRRRREASQPSRWLWAIGFCGGLLFVGLAVISSVGFGLYQSYADDLIPPDEAIAKLPRGGARILDRNGTLMYEFVDDASGLREPVTADEISLWAVLATIDVEDSSFLDNPGVNYRGLAGAAWDNLTPFGGKPGILQGRGGSSITQQLVKNVYFTPEEREKRTVERKLRETVYALELTKRYSKQQILTWYLNQISYGNVFVGIEAASQGYFGKHAKDLTLAQAALLAGVPACPTCYDPINEPQDALGRRNYVLKRMQDEGHITKEMRYAAAIEPLGVSLRPFPVEAPHFVFNVVQPQLEEIFGEEAVKRDGLIVYTTLDLNWQRKAQEILEGHITEYEDSAGGHNGAAVAIDPKTAQLLVYIGSRDYFRDDISGQNDMAQALNSPGSSFKPFTYLTAFMNLGWGPGTMILDSPISSKYWDGKNPPRNPVAHSGPISARNALGNSLNIPAVKTILYTGVPEVIKQAKKMGITSLDGRDLGPSMTVGGVDVELLDMVYGYTVFPNLGVLKGVESSVARPEGNRTTDPVSILRVEDRDGKVLYPLVDGQPADSPPLKEDRVAPAADAFLINSILSDPNAHCLTYGCGGLTIPGHPIGMKTGTSEPYETIGLIGETWTFGYTPQLVFGTWFGNADNTPMANISSYYVSARTTRDFMIAYHENLPAEAFTQPDGVVQASLCVPSGLRPSPSCPMTTNDLYAADSLPQATDNWWARTRVDKRTGKLATDSTPKRFIEERLYLNPPEGTSEFARDQAAEWAKALSGGSDKPPTESTQPADLPVAITEPQSAAPIQGVLTVTGRAASPSFQSYRLEYHYDSQPGTLWQPIIESDSPVEEGFLGNLDTTSLPGGLYTIRLVVSDKQRGDIIAEVQVLVVHAIPIGATPTAAPPEPTPAGGVGGGRGRGHNRDR